MKRVLWILGLTTAVFLVVGGVAVVVTNAASARAGRTEWPGRLGSLEDLPSRFPKQSPSAEAVQLAELAKPLGLDFGEKKTTATGTEEALGTYVQNEGARDVVAIEAPSERVTAFLAQHAAEIDAVSAHLRQSRDIQWAVDLDQGFSAPAPNLVAHVRLMRLLVARALVRARAGDPAAWDDLQAVTVLDRTLQQRSELISQIIALALARQVNATAWKLPLPAPAWFAEYQTLDRRQPLLQGMQTDTWVMWRNIPSNDSGLLQSVHLRASMANLVKHQRETAAEISRQTACAFDGTAYAVKRADDLPWWNTAGRIAFVNAPWNRAFRYEAEREATTNALKVRADQPVVAKSQCSDGTWTFEAGRIRFTGQIKPTSEKDMPLNLSAKL